MTNKTLPVFMLVCLALVISSTGLLANSPDRMTELRHRMVQQYISNPAPPAIPIHDAFTVNAMKNVERHRFVPAQLQNRAYENRPLPIGHGQTISQPYIVGLMTTLLNVNPGDTVLEIGAGSGYQAAVLADFVEHVFTIEIIPELAERSKNTLAEQGYSNVSVKHGDGYYGWEEHAPFDGIIVTAASSHIPPPLVEQLRHGGRMIIPVGPPFQTQRLMLVEKTADGSIRQRSLIPVRFVPFTRK